MSDEVVEAKVLIKRLFPLCAITFFFQASESMPSAVDGKIVVNMKVDSGTSYLSIVGHAMPRICR